MPRQGLPDDSLSQPGPGQVLPTGNEKLLWSAADRAVTMYIACVYCDLAFLFTQTLPRNFRANHDHGPESIGWIMMSETKAQAGLNEISRAARRRT